MRAASSQQASSVSREMADASHAAEAEVDEARDKVALTVQLTREADGAVTANEDAVDELASITEAIARLAEGAARPLHLRRFLAEESIRGLRSLRASKTRAGTAAGNQDPARAAT
jgi:hypothetical protein